jgi:FMNH2-dependent dimethyl sulfone monooxygenase
VPASALGAGLAGTLELIVDRNDQYSAAGVQLLMLRFHPMMNGLRTFIDRILPEISQRRDRKRFQKGLHCERD